LISEKELYPFNIEYLIILYFLYRSFFIIL